MSTALDVSPETLRDLGWSRIQQALADRASTEPGRDACLDLGFCEDAESARELLLTTDELVSLLTRGGDLPLSGTRDVIMALRRATRGAVLSPDELVAIARTADAAVTTRRHLTFHALQHPRLGVRAQLIPELNSLARELNATFDESGQIRDDASPALAAARSRLISLHRHMKERLEAYVARLDLADVLQDNFYTQRDERYVVPVISSFQREVPGIIHGSSNSGETVFIEPGEFIEGNNAIKVADANVRAETERVLKERTAWVLAEAQAIQSAFDALVELDTIQARARLASDMDATVPILSKDGAMRLIAARNPHLLLKGSRVIPNDITLAPKESFLVITGPNTGGKTVTLSTVGTFVMMLAAGCPIPASEASEVTNFSSLFALIGDAQDIERDLSTFSGHLLAIQEILDCAEPGALVLLDEIITGTEPTQGASLAISVLESLASRGARGLVTTHYERLKTLPFEDARFGNASVGIDERTQAPTFVLTAGRPGSSNPFDIALRLGFPPHIIQRARAIVGGHSGLTEALDRLRQMEAEAEAERELARAERERLAAEVTRLNAERLRLRKEARVEVEAIYEDARKELKDLLALIRETKLSAPERNKDIKSFETLKRDVHAIQDSLHKALPAAEQEQSKPVETPSDAGPLRESDKRVGAKVWVRSLQKMGEILELRGGRATVAVGSLKTSVHVADLGRVPAQFANQGQVARVVPSPAPGHQAQRRQKLVELSEDDQRVTPLRNDEITVDLRGARRDEVTERIEPVLDRAYREGSEAIWIIHGHGTGAMRDEVREFLSRSPLVSAFRRGKRHEGGDGVTIAFLAKD